METYEKDYQIMMNHIADLHKENRLLRQQLTNGSERKRINTEPSHYLPISTVAMRIGYAVKTIYNLISQGVLQEGVHYFKPTKRKLLFYWPAIEQWIMEKHDG